MAQYRHIEKPRPLTPVQSGLAALFPSMTRERDFRLKMMSALRTHFVDELPILGLNEPPPFRVRNTDGRGSCIVICDHSSNRIPASLGNLGLPPHELRRHIAVDIGSEDVGTAMSHALDAPVIFATYSRLVLDLNRGQSNPQQIPPVSDGTVVPGNLSRSLRHKFNRYHEIYIPYHRKVEEMIERMETAGKTPVLLFIHSCTPEMNGVKRPWHIGVLWDRDEKLAKRYIEALQKDNPDLLIGDNQPYTLKAPLPGNSIERHAVSRGLPHIVLEFRQDLVDTPQKAKKMADIALKSLRPILQDPAVCQATEPPAELAGLRRFSYFTIDPRFIKRQQEATHGHFHRLMLNW